MSFLASPSGAEPWIERGGYLSNRTTIDPAAYGEPDRRFAELLVGSGPVRFDASDSLPSDAREVLLEQITTFVAEANFLQPEDDLAQLAEAVDASFADLVGEPEDAESTDDG